MRSFRDRKTEYFMKKQEKDFTKVITELANKAEYLLLDYRRETADQAKKSSGGLKRLTQGTTIEDAQVAQQLRIMNAFTEEELLDASKISWQVKQDVSHVTQQPYEEVTQLIRNFENTQKVHGFLKARKESNKALPEDMQQLHQMMGMERPRLTQKEKLQRGGSSSKKQRKFLTYRSYY